MPWKEGSFCSSKLASMTWLRSSTSPGSAALSMTRKVIRLFHFGYGCLQHESARLNYDGVLRNPRRRNQTCLRPKLTA